MFADGDGPGDPVWVNWLLGSVFVVAFLFLGLMFWAFREAKKTFIAWVTGLGMKPQVALPPTLVAPASAWRAAPATRQIYAGHRGGFECAVFEIGQTEGESQIWRTAVAVARGPVGQVLTDELKTLGATLDEDSTPGWIIGLVPSTNAAPKVMGPVLAAMTRESWPAGNGDHQLSNEPNTVNQ